MFYKFCHSKWLTLNFVVLKEIHSLHFGAQGRSKLSVVEFTNDLFVLRNHLSRIFWQRIDVVEISATFFPFHSFQIRHSSGDRGSTHPITNKSASSEPDTVRSGTTAVTFSNFFGTVSTIFWWFSPSVEMLPFRSPFPDRHCGVRVWVPGIASNALSYLRCGKLFCNLPYRVERNPVFISGISASSEVSRGSSIVQKCICQQNKPVSYIPVQFWSHVSKMPIIGSSGAITTSGLSPFRP